MAKDDTEIKKQIQKLILDSLQMDKVLRDQYQVGEKFRFIRDRLVALQHRVEEELKADQKVTKKVIEKLKEDELEVYVYIYNAQGIVFTTWQKMVNPSVLYEYSVNRPIYAKKSEVESFIRSRPNKVQHGYLTIVVKKNAIVPTPKDLESPKDQIGNPLIKVKEGSLAFDKIISFTHQLHDYEVDEEGHIVKKTEK